MVLSLAMDSREDGDSWMEEQWEKWLTHDISLNEYEDDDLSEVTEITDENGITLSQLDLNPKDHMTQPTNGTPRSGRRRGVVELQTEMLHLDLIDAEEEEEENERRPVDAVDDNHKEEQGAGPPVTQPQLTDFIPAVAMDTYRPKRPTTLNLFPQVPRTQDTINNNSFGEKERRKEKKTHSSSPHIKGDPAAKPEQVSLTDGDKVQARVDTKPRGPASSTNKASAFHTKKKDKFSESLNNPNVVAPLTQTVMREKSTEVTLIEGVLDMPTICKEKARYHTASSYREQVQYPAENEGTCDQLVDKNKDFHISEGNATEEIHLTPVNGEQERPFLSQSSDSNRMSISSDTELPPLHYYPSAGCPNPSISEEDEVYPPTPPCRTVSLSDAGDASKWAKTHKPKVAKEDTGNLKAVAVSTDASGLTYDSVKYTLVVDEHAKLELVSIKDCYKGYESDSDNTVYESAIDEDEEDQEVDEEEEESGGRGMRRDTSCLSADSTTDTTSDMPRSRKFMNIFVNGLSRFSGAEFGFFSCVINGEEREQSHRAVFRFIPRHDDELEMEADDPLLVEVQAEDLWCEAYNMRTGSRGIFPAFYAVKVTKDELVKEVKTDWMDKFWVKFLGSVQVPYHKGNDVLCAAMHKIASNRRTTMQFSPPSPCILEINTRGVKIIVQDDCRTSGRGEKCFHFFQLKNISFCGCHPKNKKYFGVITKHPAYQRFACHVFFSDDTTTKLAESIGKAFQQFYKEHMEYSCPTEDIFLE
ncbi:C-Jun-amino-terminal kinase-interacting protein 1a [Sinocyclocheilus rhinocerous]|uniref:C-Jun-amino-terminal kinase-interacting protein 1a n=1 Tax=Sinocyclocheilus rhinocerous TaxID=307959 RepID=UPI0007B8246C|nr:PREDICTED: C-Jun-amino-terminal kinase-interacting protein 1-like [Sinocyclocheilus rhinocerous]